MSGIISATPSNALQGQISCHKGQLQLVYENKRVGGYLIEPSGRVKSVTVEDFPKGINPENMQAFLNQSYVKFSECVENGAMIARLYTRGLGGGKVEQLKAELDAKGKDKKAVFISYHWDHKDLAKEVETALIAEGVMVLRDERALDQPGEDLSAFMQLINHRNLDGVISIVSDQYLKSSNCMVEVLETMKRFEWKKSFIPIVVERGLYPRGSEISYIKHWEGNKEKWQSKRDKDLATTAIMQLEEFVVNIRFTIQADVKSLQEEKFKEIVTRIVGAKASPNPEEVLPSLIEQKLQNPHKEFTFEESINVLLECIKQGKLEAQKAQGKEVIIFIGNTGAGKSTTVNYLCGCTMEAKNPKQLGIKGLGKVVVVKSPASGGIKEEVMPIGHTKESKTFMPQIETDTDTQNTYMDCPGFLDNRGPEINIANAVNIKNAIKEAKTAKVVILINYHSLKAERGRGLSEMLKIAYNLFGKEENLLASQNSLLIGITNAVSSDCDLDELREWIVEGNPTLEKLQERIFTYDPLERNIEGGWKRSDFLRALNGLKPVPHHHKIFSTVLTHEDENKLLTISEHIGSHIETALQKEDFSKASTYFLKLKSLSVIEHHTLERIIQTQRRQIESKAHTTVNHFQSHCHLEEFNQAETLLKTLQTALTLFEELTPIIDQKKLTNYYAGCQKKQQIREEREKAQQQEIRKANKRIEELIKILDDQKQQIEKQRQEHKQESQRLLKELESTYSQKLQNLETNMRELLQEKETRLAKKEEELKIAHETKDHETNQRILEEKKKLEAEYEQKLAEAQKEKETIAQEKKKTLQDQQKVYNKKDQELTKKISTIETQKVQQQKLQKGAIPDIAFGKAKWEKYFGDIGTEPPLPKDIDQILKSPCPYWSGKKVEETHLLVLIPSAVNGKAFTIGTLGEMIKNPKTGHPTKYYNYDNTAVKELKDQGISSSYWALITKDVLPNSRSKTYSEQEALIKESYAVPGALEIATGILMHHAETGERIYSDSPNTYTRCQETLSDGYHVVVGSFGSSGLGLGNCYFDYRYEVVGFRLGNFGLGGGRKF